LESSFNGSCSVILFSPSNKFQRYSYISPSANLFDIYFNHQVEYTNERKNLRDSFAAAVDRLILTEGIYVKFQELVHRQLESHFKEMTIPPGIARTGAVMENLFCSVVCIQAGIPLIITGNKYNYHAKYKLFGISGPPGCSKTLSFTLTCDNMVGPRANNEFFRKLKNVTRFNYQCSEFSTANEISGTYLSAEERQKRFIGAHMHQEQCVVFLDEGFDY
jgi:hypothetical protein